jgi:hypothetical protein
MNNLNNPSKKTALPFEYSPEDLISNDNTIEILDPTNRAITELSDFAHYCF